MNDIIHDQHFLINQSVAIEIINLLDIKEDDVILELGPGNGALSNHIKNNKHYLVEIDKKLFENLNELGYNVINSNFLKIDDTFLLKNNINKFLSNLPYSISEPFIYKILKMYKKKLDNQQNVDFSGVLMTGETFYYIMKGNFSIYSDFFLSFFMIENEILVEPHNFNPQPNVNSYVYSFRSLSKIKINNEVLVSRYLYDCYIRKIKIFSIVKNYFWNELGFSKRDSKQVSNEFLDDKEYKDKKIDNLDIFEYFQIKDFLLEKSVLRKNS